MRSVETPNTVGNCVPGESGEVCTQEVDEDVVYTQGTDFVSPTVTVDLQWCGDAACSAGDQQGRALVLTVEHHDDTTTQMFSNCQAPTINETFTNVRSITIDRALNLSDENVACGGNNVTDGAFGRWEICEPDVSAALPGNERNRVAALGRGRCAKPS